MANYRTINGKKYNLNEGAIATANGDTLHTSKHGYWLEITGDRLYKCEDGGCAEGTCIIPLTGEDADTIWHLMNNSKGYNPLGYSAEMFVTFNTGKRNKVEYKGQYYKIF